MDIERTEPTPFRPEHNVIKAYERRQRSDHSTIGTFGNRKAERKAIRQADRKTGIGWRKAPSSNRGDAIDKLIKRGLRRFDPPKHDEPETDGYKLPSEMASLQTEAVEMGSLDLGPIIEPGSPEEAEMDAIVHGSPAEPKKKRASRAKKKVETQE